MQYENLRLPLKAKGKYTSIGEFELHKKIGEGGFSDVYLATHNVTQEQVALKHIDLSRLYDSNRINVEMEIEAHTHFNHPYIIKLLDFFGQEENLYLVLEYCPAGNLFKFINQNGLLRLDDIKKVFYQVLSAVSYVHNKGYIIRDLKPENILITASADIKLCDFGWCASLMDTEYLHAQAGTFAYMSPESLRGELQSVKTDVWALGIFLYELFIGCEPYTGKSHKSQLDLIERKTLSFPDAPPVHPQAKELILASLQLDPKYRPTIPQLQKSEFLQDIVEQLEAAETRWWEQIISGDSSTQATWNELDLKEKTCSPPASPSLSRIPGLCLASPVIINSPSSPQSQEKYNSQKAITRCISIEPLRHARGNSPALSRTIRRISIDVRNEYGQKRPSPADSGSLNAYFGAPESMQGSFSTQHAKKYATNFFLQKTQEATRPAIHDVSCAENLFEKGSFVIPKVSMIKMQELNYQSDSPLAFQSAATSPMISAKLQHPVYSSASLKSNCILKNITSVTSIPLQEESRISNEVKSPVLENEKSSGSMQRLTSPPLKVTRRQSTKIQQDHRFCDNSSTLNERFNKLIAQNAKREESLGHNINIYAHYKNDNYQKKAITPSYELQKCSSPSEDGVKKNFPSNTITGILAALKMPDDTKMGVNSRSKLLFKECGSPEILKVKVAPANEKNSVCSPGALHFTNNTRLKKDKENTLISNFGSRHINNGKTDIVQPREQLTSSSNTNSCSNKLCQDLKGPKNIASAGPPPRQPTFFASPQLTVLKSPATSHLPLYARRFNKA